MRLRTLAAKSSLGSQDANFTNADCTDANFQKVSAFGVNFYAGTAVYSNKPGAYSSKPALAPEHTPSASMQPT